jgi:hypothetical protein
MLGELTYAYVVGRVEIHYVVTLLIRYSSAISPSSACASTFDALSMGGSLYWRQAPCDLLPAGDFKTLSIDNRDFPEFPKFFSLLELVGYVDTLHTTELRTGRQVTGLSFCVVGGAITFKLKLQPTAVTTYLDLSKSKRKFMAASESFGFTLTVQLRRSTCYQLGPATVVAYKFDQTISSV